jgi:hypothetical protein
VGILSIRQSHQENQRVRELEAMAVDLLCCAADGPATLGSDPRSKHGARRLWRATERAHLPARAASL